MSLGTTMFVLTHLAKLAARRDRLRLPNATHKGDLDPRSVEQSEEWRQPRHNVPLGWYDGGKVAR